MMVICMSGVGARAGGGGDEEVRESLTDEVTFELRLEGYQLS